MTSPVSVAAEPMMPGLPAPDSTVPEPAIRTSSPASSAARLGIASSLVKITSAPTACTAVHEQLAPQPRCSAAMSLPQSRAPPTGLSVRLSLPLQPVCSLLLPSSHPPDSLISCLRPDRVQPGLQSLKSENK